MVFSMMPKPFASQPGGGMRFRRLAVGRERCLFDDDGTCATSSGGVLAHSARPRSAGRADGNSYKRLVVGESLSTARAGRRPMSRTGRTTARRWCARWPGASVAAAGCRGRPVSRHGRADRRRPGRHRLEDRPGPGLRRRSLPEQPLAALRARGIGDAAAEPQPKRWMRSSRRRAVRSAGRHAGARVHRRGAAVALVRAPCQRVGDAALRRRF